MGAVFRSVRMTKPDILRGIGAAALVRSLTGRRVVSVERRAKHAVIGLDDGRRLVIQPRMTGSLLVTTKAAAADPYVALAARLSTGRHFVYRDVRRLGTVHLLGAAAWERYTARLGPEPLEPGFTPARLAALLAGGRLAVKKALMDQRRLAGLGNIHAAEALWRAKIHPGRPTRTLELPEWNRLAAAIRRGLAYALAAEDSEEIAYVEEPGTENPFRVYARAGERCPRCGTRIRLLRQGGRRTDFCPHCQPARRARR